MRYLWEWFNDLTDWRTSGFGIGALSHLEIEAWARLMQLEIRPFEVDVLRRLDREYRLFVHELNNPEPEPIGPQLERLAKSIKDG